MKLAETYTRKENEHINYLVYLPDNGGENLPMVTFLHGAGERGSRFENLYRLGLPRLIKEGKDYPAIIFIPQCHEKLVWQNLPCELMALIDKVADKYGADRARISITGGSMGGFGTWEMGMTFPNKFSVLAPICGGGASWRAPNLITTPIITFHGSEDPTVPIFYSKMMVDAVNKAGGNAKLNVFDGACHNDTIDRAYEETDLMDILINTVRTDFSEVKETFSEFYGEV